MKPDPSNSYFEMAVKFVNQTSRHIFLTGKAGTGKTTFLKYIKENSYKKLAVIAPTGVAAINAGGVTIHSFFQLPMGNFLPDEKMIPSGNFYNRRSLLKQLRLTGTKRKIIQELDLLIIDEVSMVRADLLDAMDCILKHIRRKSNVPFGGVQMLYIGDLFQLPPVMNDETWSVLKHYYQSPFFFHAHGLQHTPPLYLELKKIYRQSDEIFIRLLNNLRNNCVQKEDIKLLNQYYQPNFKPEAKGEYITLTTHNYKADQINKNELEKLSGKVYTFEATIEGEFNDKLMPANVKLQLKTGAQIMFIRNDMGENRRYSNGKIGTITRIEEEDVFVKFPGEETELKLEKETWENIRYKYNSETDQIEKELVGTFTQYPIRLAWAITIHKSQGLTFTKAIIDAGASFAPGQVYVALSRLTSLDGLVLLSPILADSILTDSEALTFSATEQGTDAIVEQLQKEQKRYIHRQLVEAFDWGKTVSTLETFLKEMDNRKISAQEEAKTEIGASHRLSLDMFKNGKSIKDIAIDRGLATGTIEGHLISFISSGELDIKAIVTEEKINAIQQTLKELGEVSSSIIKEKLGETFSYGEIRAVITHYKKLQETV